MKKLFNLNSKLKIRNSKLLLLILLFLSTINYQLSTLMAQSHQKAGTNTAQMLELTRGARPTALGGAYVGVADDVNAITYNPAGLGFLRKNEVQFNQHKSFDAFIANDIQVVYPLTQMQAKDIQNFGAIAGGISYIDYGRLPGRDIFGRDTGEFGAQDRILTLGYGKAFSENFAFGINARQLREDISGIKAQGYSFDTGIFFREFIEKTSVGATVRNVGSRFALDQGGDPLPTVVTIGGSSQAFNRRLILAADFNKPVHNYYYWNIGAEFYLTKILALRLGYDTRIKIGSNISGGIGLSVYEFDYSFLPFSELALNYSYSSYGDLGDNHQIEMLIKMGVE